MEYNKGIKSEWESIGNKIIYSNGNVSKDEVFKIQKKNYVFLNIINYSVEDKYIEIYNIQDINIHDIIYDNTKNIIGKIIKIVNNKIFLDKLNSELENIVLIEKKYTDYSLNRGQNIIFPQDDKHQVFIQLNDHGVHDKNNLEENQRNSINSENIITVFITTCIGFVIGSYIFNRHLK